MSSEEFLLRAIQGHFQHCEEPKGINEIFNYNLMLLIIAAYYLLKYLEYSFLIKEMKIFQKGYYKNTLGGLNIILEKIYH